MVTISDARLDYPEHMAFANFSLAVKTGEMVSIIGKSGCGKTSLLYAIAGLLPLSEGTLSLTEETEACSIMFQQDRLLPWKTVLGNVLLGLTKDSEQQAGMLLDRMGLHDHRKKYPQQLSGGERQRVALVRSLVRNPRLLLLDEPLAALDEQNRELLQQEIKEFVITKGITLIMVTHSIQEAIYMGSRILVMQPDGIHFETENPYHGAKDLRDRTEFFALEKVLRAQLGGPA